MSHHTIVCDASQIPRRFAEPFYQVQLRARRTVSILSPPFPVFPPHCILRQIGNNTGFTLCPASKERTR
jgi:hypothetical protein